MESTTTWHTHNKKLNRKGPAYLLLYVYLEREREGWGERQRYTPVGNGVCAMYNLLVSTPVGNGVCAMYNLLVIAPWINQQELILYFSYISFTKAQHAYGLQCKIIKKFTKAWKESGWQEEVQGEVLATEDWCLIKKNKKMLK